MSTDPGGTGMLVKVLKNAEERIRKAVEKTVRVIKHILPAAGSPNKGLKFFHLGVISAVFLLAVGVFSENNLQPKLGSVKEAPSYNENELVVIQSTPQGSLQEISLSKEIVVVFNRPMVPLGTFRERSTAPIRIEPAVKGTYHWHGSRVASFRPGKQLAPGTRYKVTVPASARSLDGKRLGKDHVFTFTTPMLKVRSRSPWGGKVAYEQEFRLYFNYPVSLDEARDHIRLNVNNRLHPVTMRHAGPREASGDYRIKKNTFKNVVIIKPARILPRGASLVLSVSRGMLPLGGNIGMPQSKNFRYQTYGPLTARLKSKARFFQQAYSLGIRFNNPVKEEDVKKHVRISPNAEYLYDRSSGRTTYLAMRRWNVRPEKKYTVTISPALTDAYGNRITGTRTFTIVTPRYRRSIHLKSGVNHIEAIGPRWIPVDVAGVEKVNMEVGTFTLIDVLARSADARSSGRIPLDTEKTFTFDTGISRQRSGRVGFNLDSYLDGKADWIGVTVDDRIERYDGREARYRQTQYIQSTDMGMVTRAGTDGYHTWIHSLSTGEPVSGAVVIAYSGKDRIGRATTDSRGYCGIAHDSHVQQKHLVFYAEKGEDRVFITGRDHNVSLWSISPHFRSNAHLPSLTGQVVFDRRLYRPGETVRFAAFLARWQDGELRSGGRDLGPMKVTVNNSRGTSIYTKTLSTTDGGGVSGELTIPDDAPTGHFTVIITSKKLDSRKNAGDSIRETFQVEEFKPVEFTVSWNDMPGSVLLGKTLKGELEGRYLFGAPMQNARARWQVNRKVINPRYERKRGFFFGDDDYGDRWKPASFSMIKQETGALDTMGRMQVSYPLERVKPEGFASRELSRSYSLEIEGRVTDVNDRTVSGRQQVNVYAGEVLPGLKVRDRYQNVKETFEFELTSVKNDGSKAKPVNAEVIIHRKEWKTIQSKSPGGTVQRRNVLVRREVHNESIKLSDEIRDYEYKAEKPGSYTITVRIRGSMAYSRMNFHAFGGGFIGWNFHNDDTVTLVPDRDEYSPGDTAKILIQSPFRESTAVVTLEREGILWQKSYNLIGNGTPVEVPILEKHAPNVYLSVMLVRPRTRGGPGTRGNEELKEDLGRPKIAFGVVRLNVDLSKKRIPLALSTNRKSYGPGDDMEIEIRTEPGAEVVLSVADRGVLDLINYRFSDPLGIFYNSRPHGVSVFDNRQSLIERMNFASKGKEPGGKGWKEASRNGEGGFSEDSEDGIRKNFRYTAHWEASLKADSRGRVKVRFRLPHNLTTFRIQALAAKKGRYNRATKEFQVRKPLVVRPLAPRFIRPGDRLQVGALVTNQTDAAVTLNVSMKAEKLNFAEGSSRKITLAAGQSREVSFPATLNVKRYMASREKALARLKKRPKGGKLDLEDMIIRASGVSGIIRAEPVDGNRSLSDKMTVSFPVVETPPVEAFAVAGFTNSSEMEGVKTPDTKTVLEGLGYLELSMASTALTGLSNAFDFYYSNPYFCLEQRASAFLVRLAAGDLLTDFDYAPPPGKGYNFELIEKLFLDELTSFQNGDGGFRPWKDMAGPHSSPYLTAYVVYVLQAARESRELGGASYSINDRVFERALSYLKRYVQTPPKGYRGYIHETLSLIHYVLSREGESSSSMERYLLENREHLSLRAKGYLALSIADRRKVSDYKTDDDLSELMREFKNRMQITTARISFDEDRGPFRMAYYSTGSVTGVMLRAFMKLEPKNPLIPKIINQIMTDKANRYWNDSHSAGILSHALFRFRHLYEKNEPDFTGRVNLAKNEVFTSRFRGRSDARKFKRIYLDDLREIAPPGKLHPMSFRADGRGRLYYRATMVYSPAINVREPLDEGIEIRREYKPVKNPNAETMEAGVTKSPLVFKRGDVYLVRVTVTAPKPIYNFIYRDPLPSGVEAVITSFDTESASYSRFVREKEKGSGGYYWHYSAERKELRDDVAIITQDYLSPGVHEYFYLVRATVRGRMQLPPAEGFGMYEPFIMGRTGSAGLVIQ